MTNHAIRRPGLVYRGLILALALSAAAAGAAEADWLVMTDGTRVETRGAWEQRGRRIVFTAADGTLSSLKADQVDLAASRRATEQATAAAAVRSREAPTERPAPSPRRATRRWTNADIPRGAPPSTSTAVAETGVVEEPASEGEVTDGPAELPPSPVVVEGWEQGESVDGSVVILGRVVNSSDRVLAAAVRLDVILFDRESRRLAEQAASVVPTSLPPGGTGEFRAEFPGIYDFSLVKFDLASTGVETGEGTPPRALGPNAAASTDEEDGAGP